LCAYLGGLGILIPVRLHLPPTIPVFWLVLLFSAFCKSSFLPHHVLDQQQAIVCDLIKIKYQAFFMLLSHSPPVYIRFKTYYWLVARERVFLLAHHSPHWATQFLLCIKVLLLMLFAYIIVEPLLGYQLTVFVVVNLQLLTHFAALTVPSFPTIRHNNIRDFTALLLFEVCHDVKIEHYLQSNHLLERI